MRLLVLDDDAATARLVSRIATAAGFATLVANDADAFRTNYRAALPDIIILDLLLGDTDGVEQLRLLAEWRFPGSLILMTGFDDETLAATGELAVSLGLRMVATLGKPIDVPHLRQVLAELRS
jgi:two-component system, chemotaxis family, chemotaxis protein CheY